MSASTEPMSFERVPAVVVLPFPESVPTGLGLVRSLGQEGVPVVAVGPSRDCLSLRSRYAARIAIAPGLASDAQSFARSLVSVGRRISPKPVLFVSTDFQAAVVSSFADRLREFYHYPFLPQENLSVALDKRETCAAAERAGVGAPATVVAAADLDISEALEEVRLPVVVKPARWVTCRDSDVLIHEAFRKMFGQKAVRASTAEDLASVLDRALPLQLPIIVQEEIPGPSSQIYGTSVYADAECRVRAIFVGRKTRQLPSDFGTGTLMENLDCPELADLSSRLVAAAGYSGVAELEFKFDDRDGQYKIMEINPRPGTWITVAPASGVNTPYAAYLDLLGRPVPEFEQTRHRVKWIDGWPDLEYLYHYRTGDHTGSRLSVAEYLHSLRGRREYAYWRWQDPRPGLIRLKSILGDMWRRLLRKARLPLVGALSRRAARALAAAATDRPRPASSSGR